MSTKHDQHENQAACGTHTSPLAKREAQDAQEEAAPQRTVADDLHALALIVAAALSGPLASEWHAL